MCIPRKGRRNIGILSSILGILLLVVGFVSVYILRIDLIFSLDEVFFYSLVVALFPPAILNTLDSRWRNEVDRRIPEFLNEIAESGRTGITLTRSIELSAKRKYGPLSSELQRVATLLSWGRRLEDVLKEFADRVDTTLSRRTAILITETNRSGGEMKDILETLSRHIGELQTIEEEQNSMIRPYIGIMYIAFFIFLFIAIMLIRTFFFEIESMRAILEEGGGGLFGQGIELSKIERVMFHLSLIEGFFSGLVAGKMGEGTMGAGLKHSLLMIVIGFIAFFVFVWHQII